MSVMVSVIIPTHNREQLLKKALLSVLAQTFKDFEVIVVNDASTDNTLAMLEDMQRQDDRIKILTNKKAMRGAQSRNCGIEISTGQWIAFLDDDDIWLPEKLMQQVSVMRSHPEAVASTCDYVVHYPFKIKRHITPPRDINYTHLLRSNSLGGASVCMCSATTLKAIGGFDKYLRSSQDWDLWLRLRHQGKIVCVPMPLVAYQVHFNYRISTDMSAKYLGARRFYLKYKDEMDLQARLENLGFICFIQSRQKDRSALVRWKKLMMAMKYSPRKVGFRYFLSSFPRLVVPSW